VFALAHLPFLFAAVTAAAPAPRGGVRLPPPSACAAVTRTEVEQALGTRAGQGQPQRSGAESACDYAAGRGLVTISIQRLRAEPDLRAEMESLRAAIPEGTIREAPGMGGRAFFVDIAGAGTQLHVIRGEYAVLVSVLGLGEPAQVSDAAMAIARQAVGRL
jgi:hypothetical protein